MILHNICGQRAWPYSSAARSSSFTVAATLGWAPDPLGDAAVGLVAPLQSAHTQASAGAALPCCCGQVVRCRLQGPRGHAACNSAPLRLLRHGVGCTQTPKPYVAGRQTALTRRPAARPPPAAGGRRWPPSCRPPSASAPAAPAPAYQKRCEISKLKCEQPKNPISCRPGTSSTQGDLLSTVRPHCTAWGACGGIATAQGCRCTVHTTMSQGVHDHVRSQAFITAGSGCECKRITKMQSGS